MNKQNFISFLNYEKSHTKWALKEKGVGFAVGKNKDDCPRLRSKGQLYAVATECRGNPVRSVRKSTTAKVQKKTPNITLKPIGKSELIGGNTFSYSGVQKNGVERYFNKKGSVLLFYPKVKKWALHEKGIGQAIGNAGETCPILKKNGKMYAFSVSCVPWKSEMKTKDWWQKRQNQSKAVNKKSVTKKKTASNKKSKKNKKSPKKEKKSKKSKPQKKSVTLKPVGKKAIVGGNKFKSAGVRKDGAKKFSNGQSELLFYPKDKKWSLKEKGLGWASGKKGEMCPKLVRKGKLYATSTKCVPKKKKTPNKKSKKKSTKKSKKKKTKKQPSKKVSKKSKKTKSPKKSFITLKPVGKKAIVGGNKFKSAGVRKDGAKKYSNGKSKLLFYPKDKKWALKEKGLGWASSKKGEMCPKLVRKGKLYATSTKCVPKKKKTPNKKSKKKSTKKSKKKKTKKQPSKKVSKKSKKTKSPKKSFITLKPVGKKAIVGGNKFKSAGVRKDGAKKYSNGKSKLLFYPKDKKWALKEKGLGWASSKKGKMCPTLSRKGKLYATSTKCVPKKTKKKKTTSKKSKKKATKKSKKSKAKKKPSITLKPIGKKSIVGGNKFKFTGLRKDGAKKYSNGKSELLFYPKDKKWSLKEKGIGWASGKKGQLCPTLLRKGKLYATSTKCSPKKKKAKKTTKKSSKKRVAKKSKKSKAQKKSFVTLKPVGKKAIFGGNKFKSAGVRKDGTKKYSNGKSVLLFYPKDKKWALKEKGLGWATGKKGQMCPTLSRKGKLYATSTECVPKNKNISSKKGKKIAKRTSKKSKKSKSKNKSFITLKPVGKKSIVGGNVFKSAGIRKDGVRKYTNGKSELLFYPNDKKWSLKEKGIGWASGKKGQMCPTLSRKGKLYATSTRCVINDKKSSKKSSKKNKKTKTKYPKTNVTKIVKLKPVPKYQIDGGNTFKFQKVRKDGILKYSNGKAKLIVSQFF